MIQLSEICRNGEMAGAKDLVIAGTRRLGDDSLLKTSLLLRSMNFFDIFFYTIFRLYHSIFYFSPLSEV